MLTTRKRDQCAKVLRLRTKKNKNTGCLEWIAGVDFGGYGQFRYAEGITLKAHRVALELSLNRRLTVKEFACHKCQNRKCVRVGRTHVYLGNAHTNAVDRYEHGYVQVNKKGYASPFSKLNREQVASIRASHKSQRALASEFGVCQATIGNLLLGVTYAL